MGEETRNINKTLRKWGAALKSTDTKWDFIGTGNGKHRLGGKSGEKKGHLDQRNKEPASEKGKIDRDQPEQN